MAPTITSAKLPERNCRLKFERERQLENIFIFAGAQNQLPGDVEFK
jgi:hypothetical protein